MNMAGISYKFSCCNMARNQESYRSTSYEDILKQASFASSASCSSNNYSLSSKEVMDMMALGPALNTNSKP
jgi:hypothetical protein